ncbi:MAG: bifunctional demethylmenaquinone methyltransferase/2-methoxy-6-polyprenyl-1,4-benzoquinol methylase UbiE [Phycisphaerales bacterium]|nr:MAG: bifunctional demethylmenaquinone methyltransferase/2-methoxy-6-polyprenyl-1,4-benzoquinol methylase UbiE [Phycisphaerales bacterium]
MTRRAVSSSPPAWTASDLRGNPHQEATKADRVRKMFAAIARRYDLNNHLHSFGRDQFWRRRAVRLAEVKSGDRVLDAACGTGDLAEAFADACPASVMGVDFTLEMLDLAKAKTARRRRPAGCPAPEYVQGDAMHLPFEDETFDIVSIAFGIRNVGDAVVALREFRRVLRPGGRLVILEFSEPSNAVLRLINRIYSRHIMPVTAALIARDRVGAYRYLPRSVATFLDRKALRDAIEQAGFVSVQQHPLTFGVCVAYIAFTE